MRRALSGYTIPLRAMGLVSALVLLTEACSLPGTPAATPTEATPTWDYVALGDSTPTGYGVQKSYIDIYAEYIEADLGVMVRVHNWARNGQSAAQLLTALQGDEALRDDIHEAEVITIWTGANDILPRVGIYPAGGICGKWRELDMECVREGVTTLKASIDAIIAEILSLRSPDETLILIADVGNPLASQWRSWVYLMSSRVPSWRIRSIISARLLRRTTYMLFTPTGLSTAQMVIMRELLQRFHKLIGSISTRKVTGCLPISIENWGMGP